MDRSGLARCQIGVDLAGETTDGATHGLVHAENYNRNCGENQRILRHRLATTHSRGSLVQSELSSERSKYVTAGLIRTKMTNCSRLRK